ncbi:MAG: hypothetical protein IPM63_14310 [Acidobacteriota bacterium]|nr:MAG: hypothetical protein IPM63_14310 [Acidobacteriota bacterium]
MKKTPLILILLPLLVLSLFQQAFACACCAEKGTYFSSKSAVDDYEREILSKMKYASESSLYLDAAGFEIVRGLDALRQISESSETWSEFDEIGTRVGVMSTSWMFTFSLKDAVGALTIPIPAEREYYAADIHDGEDSPGGGPLLYKELKFRGKVGSASDMFSAGFKGGADYFLVFQGRGNGCNNVEDFTHWRLSVNGPNANYAFFGALTSGDVRTAGASQDTPKFEDHKAEVWNGTVKAVNLDSHKDARMFRTRLTEAQKEGVNFAGHFILTYWGCGTNCLVGAVIDAKTGRVYFPEQMAGLGVGLPGTDIEAEALEFKKDSSLVVVRGALSDDERVGTHYLVWEGNGFRQLNFVGSE